MGHTSGGAAQRSDSAPCEPMGYGLKYVAPDNAVRFDSLTAPDIGRRLLTPDMRMSRSFNPQRSCWRGGRW